MKVLVVHERDLVPLPNGSLNHVGAICGSRGGGLATDLVVTINYMRDSGIDIAVIGFDPEAAGVEQLAHQYYRLRSFRFRKLHNVIAGFKEIVEKERPDLIHLQGVFFEINPEMMKWITARYPVVWTLHDVRPLCFRGTRIFKTGAVCSRAIGKACVMCGCYFPGEREPIPQDTLRILFLEKYLREYRKLKYSTVVSAYLGEVLIQNGFDPATLSVTPLFSRFETVSKIEATNNTKPRILFIGRHDHDKGVMEFVDVMGRLRDLDWQGVVVGDGPCRAEAQALAEKLQIADRLEFPGAKTGTDVTDEYRKCDFLVFSSIIPEGWGLAAMEAMGFGKPVAAFEVGGTKDYLRHEKNSLLANYRDMDGLAAQVRRLIVDVPLRLRLGQAALECIRHEFSVPKHVESLKKVFDEVLRERV